MAHFKKLTRPAYTLGGPAVPGSRTTSTQVPASEVWVNMDTVAYVARQRQGHVGNSLLTFVGISRKDGSTFELSVEESPEDVTTS